MNTSWEAVPADYTPSAPTPLEDFISKVRSMTFVVDPGTKQERSYRFTAQDIMDVRTAHDFFPETGPDWPIALFLAKLPPLPPGDHRVGAVIEMSARALRRPGNRPCRQLPSCRDHDADGVPVQGRGAERAGLATVGSQTPAPIVGGVSAPATPGRRRVRMSAATPGLDEAVGRARQSGFHARAAERPAPRQKQGRVVRRQKPADQRRLLLSLPSRCDRPSAGTTRARCGRGPRARSLARLTLASARQSRRDVGVRRDDCGSSNAVAATQPPTRPQAGRSGRVGHAGRASGGSASEYKRWLRIGLLVSGCVRFTRAAVTGDWSVRWRVSAIRAPCRVLSCVRWCDAQCREVECGELWWVGAAAKALASGELAAGEVVQASATDVVDAGAVIDVEVEDDSVEVSWAWPAVSRVGA